MKFSELKNKSINWHLKILWLVLLICLLMVIVAMVISGENEGIRSMIYLIPFLIYCYFDDLKKHKNKLKNKKLK